MAAGGITLEYLSYSGAKDNPGGGCRAVFNFQGSDGGALYVGYTFQIGFDYEPKAVVLANNVLVEGLTGVVTEVAHETASYATGKLEIYALQYGTTYDIATFDMSGTPMSDITFTPQANNSIKAKNLVSGTLADDITTSTTNILVHIADNISAQGITDFFPNPPFYITIMPKTPTIGVANRLDSEIIKITNVGHDQVGNAALTGVRAQRDTTAKAFSTGDIVTVGSYCDDAVLLGGTGTTETEQPWIKNGDIVDNTIENSKIKWNGFFEEITSNGQTAWKFPDGKLICFGKKLNAYNVSGQYEGAYYTGTSSNLASIFAVPFISAPTVTVTLEYNSGLLSFNFTDITTTGFSGYIWKSQAKNNIGVGVHYIAIGRWK